MLVETKDLQRGDVVIITANGTMFEAKLLRQPKHSITKKPLTWRNTQKWCSIPCAIRVETVSYTCGTGTNVRSYTQKRAVIANGKEYNEEKRINFTDRDVWLIKRETI